MIDFSSDWWSLVPPLVAILLAIATRRVVVSLFLGIVMGVVILECRRDGATFIHGLTELGETHLWNQLADGDHLRVFAFTLVMGAMIGVINRAGGMHGVVISLAPLARSQRGGQLMTWALGLIVFIDDYANTLLLGNTMRPLTDRLKISREKLAYLVDSTAAPVSGLALVSTWVAGEIGYIEDGYKAALPEVAAAGISGFDVFIKTIPYRFYVLFALAFVFLVGLLRRDFGPMRKAEERALAGQAPDWQLKQDDELARETLARDGIAHRWINAVIPVVITVFVTVLLLGTTGIAELELAEKMGPLQGLREVLNQPPGEDGRIRQLMNIVGNGNSYIALLYGALAGLISVTLLVISQRLLTLREIRRSAFHGAALVLPALTILWLSWTLSGVTSNDHLGTGTFLGQQIEGAVSAAWMPTIVFLLASFIAFSTGTSWGTMGILMPIVVPATYGILSAAGGEISPTDPILIASIGSVLAGAIFGDHCSPISDTTVLSSQASGCDHIAHVRTQLPYAIVVAVISIVVGTVPVGFGIPVWLVLGIGLLALIGALIGLGKRAEVQ